MAETAWITHSSSSSAEDRGCKGKRERKIDHITRQSLSFTAELDKGCRQRSSTRDLLEKIIQADNIEAETEKNLENISELFLQIVEDEIDKARKQGDLDRIQKLERVMIVIRKAMEPPQEVKVIEEMLALVDKQDELEKYLDAHPEASTPELVQLLNGILTQAGDSKDENLQKIDQLYKAVLQLFDEKDIVANKEFVKRPSHFAEKVFYL